MKKFLILVLIIAGFTSCKKKNAWTPAYEKKIYTTINSGLVNVMSDSGQRKEFCAYMVMRLKKELPYGLESVPGDSLRKLSAVIGANYEQSHKSKTINAVIPWSKETESALKFSMQSRLTNKVSQEAKNRYCDCIITNLKKIYPSSLISPVPDSTSTKLNAICAQALLGK